MVEELKTPEAKFAPHPQISGKNGGESLNLHQFARDGVVLLGHVRDAHDGQLIIAPDLKQTLAKVDQFETDALVADSSGVFRDSHFSIEVIPPWQSNLPRQCGRNWRLLLRPHSWLQSLK